ncbi:peptide deformylase [Patescibacteria group bacterium]|nr:peptide deformylase [Patescibacteria group bacterium]MBU1867947.1 peptide deformylase [Patescibacteria group bacterium]
MSIIPIVQLGNPILRQKASEISRKDLFSKETRRVIRDLKDSLDPETTAGLAAPQINQPVRIIALQLTAVLPIYQRTRNPVQVLINPRIIDFSQDVIEDWEGCVSFDFLRGLVARHQSVIVEAWDKQGKEITIEAFDLHARLLQHEIDHLDGILYLDRMTDFKSLMSTDEFEKEYQNGASVD